MCGINLIIDKQKSLPSDHITKMSEFTMHRGPDETSIRIIESDIFSYHLAANRLKITDQTKAAAQPFTSEDSRYILIFNGEVYNFYDLKNILINKNITFRSCSDTEVLFHWIMEYGTNGIKDLEGMFAFIFIDFIRDEVIVARDRFGIKPIYYYQDNRFFIASSEIKPIISNGLITKALDPSQIHHYLLYKYAKPPKTFYQDVFELERGHILHFQNQEWKNFLSANEESTKEEGIPDISKVEELITNSLLQQLDLNVPAGLLLSGGVDSTLLLAIAHKQGFTLPTFSIVNSSKDKSYGTKDYHYSKLAASTYLSDHHELEVDISLLDQFDDFVSNTDQPIGDSSYLMTSAICKRASESMKILLSGAGADELFAGYNRHYAFYHYLNNKKIYDYLMPYLQPVLSNLPSGPNHPLRKFFKLVTKWSGSYNKSPIGTFQNYLTFSNIEVGNHHISYENSYANLFEWALKHDQNFYLVNDVLALSDRASMLHGIEMRVPYLDEKLVCYLSNFPTETRIIKGQKWILKEILKKHGGKRFADRPKEGFGLPLTSWLFDKKTKHLWEIFESKNILLFEYLDRNIFEKLVKQQKRKAEDHGPFLWSILVLAHWLEKNF